MAPHYPHNREVILSEKKPAKYLIHHPVHQQEVNTFQYPFKILTWVFKDHHNVATICIFLLFYLFMYSIHIYCLFCLSHYISSLCVWRGGGTDNKENNYPFWCFGKTINQPNLSLTILKQSFPASKCLFIKTLHLFIHFPIQ